MMMMKVDDEEGEDEEGEEYERGRFDTPILMKSTLGDNWIFYENRQLAGSDANSEGNTVTVTNFNTISGE